MSEVVIFRNLPGTPVKAKYRKPLEKVDRVELLPRCFPLSAHHPIPPCPGVPSQSKGAGPDTVSRIVDAPITPSSGA